MIVTRSRRLDDLLKDSRGLKKENNVALNSAQGVAKRVSRKTFRDRLVNKSQRPDTNPKRESTGGKFDRHIDWKVDGDRIRFQKETLAAQAEYWLIQEIGTGEKARILDENRGVSVKSQRGRRISTRVRFLNDSGNPVMYSSSVRGQPTKFLDDVEMMTLPRPKYEPVIIENEIEGKHYIQQGGRAGLRTYRRDLKTAFDRLGSN